MKPLRMTRRVMRAGILLACLASGSPPATYAAEVRHVVLISIDGLAASYLDDPRAELPTIRMLAQAGARADGMITTFPSVTWPSHTSLVTGATAARHGVIGNSVYDRQAEKEVVYLGDPQLEKDQAIKVPTLYDAAHAAGLKCGSVIWPCCNGAASLDWIIPDSNKPELHARYTTRGFADELKQAGIDISPLGTWGWNKQYSTQRDDLDTRVALYLLQQRQANLVLLHLITPDGIEHAYGPHTPEAYIAVREADANVKRVWEALQQPPLAGRATLFVTSDHGFAPIARVIRPNAELRRMGLIETDAGNKPRKRQAWCVAQGGSAFVYVLEAADRAARVAALKQSLGRLEGVERVIAAGDFHSLGLPLPDQNPQAPDLILACRPGYSFSNEIAGESVGPTSPTSKGTHGHLPEPAYMHATFVAAGAGIKPGVRLATVRNLDVAPTIAHLLGIQLPSADGRVLSEILAD